MSGVNNPVFWDAVRFVEGFFYDFVVPAGAGAEDFYDQVWRPSDMFFGDDEFPLFCDEKKIWLYHVVLTEDHVNGSVSNTRPALVSRAHAYK